MGYSNKIVLINNVDLHVGGIGILGGVLTQSASAKIPLDTGQKVTFGRIFVQITTPPHFVGAKVSVYWNDSFVGDILIIQHGLDNGNNIDYLNGTGSEDITNLIDPTGVKNNLVLKLDNEGASLDFTVYADFYYELNTSTPPTKDPSVTNPPSGAGPPDNGGNPFQFPSWDQLKPYVAVAAVGLGIVIIAQPLVGALVRPSAPKCRGPLCALLG